MDLDTIFNRLWVDYTERNPSVQKIVDLFDREGETIKNDHIAFRTLDYPAINIDVIARPFVQKGYAAKGEYLFKDKHLFARHFDIPDNPGAPRVFISQLILSEFSEKLQRLFRDNLESQLPEKFDSANHFLIRFIMNCGKNRNMQHGSMYSDSGPTILR
jgi:hypothetical protein